MYDKKNIEIFERIKNLADSEDIGTCEVKNNRLVITFPSGRICEIPSPSEFQSESDRPSR